jgi:DNA-binding beta-propeller fold protein YncE
MKQALLIGLVAAGCGDNFETPRTCDESGQACVFVGKSGVVGFNGDGHDRLDTELYWTMDLHFAGDGTVWFIDWNNHLIRRILTDNTVTTVVGWTDPVFPGDGLPGPSERSAEGALGTDVQLNHPTDLAETADGKILVMAWHNHKLREIDPATGRVRIIAGAGAGYTGDGATAMTATFKQPKGLELDAAGNMYILDQQNFRIRKIDAATGAMALVAGNGMQGGDGDGGLATDAKLGFEAGSNPEPSGGFVFAGNTLYVADTLSSRIRAIDLTTGMIDTVVGTGTAGYSGDGKQAREAQLAFPRDLEIGPEGDLYIADTDNNVIRAVNLTSGVIRTVAGTGTLGLDLTDDLPARQTQLARPFGIEFDPDARTGPQPLHLRHDQQPHPQGGAMKAGFAVLALAACGGDSKEACDPTIVGDICTIAGDGSFGYAGDDGPAVEARMSLPQDTLVIAGEVYILDWNNHRIRKVDASGTLRHVAGRGELGGTLDDPANSDLNHPTGLVFDQARNRLVVAAWHNSKIREIDLATGEIVDAGGDGRRAYFGDDGPVLTATLDLPASLAYAPSGDLIVMDQANQVLRRIDSTGAIHRLAGRCVVDAPPPQGGGPCAAGVEPTACPSPSGKFTCGAIATCAAPCTPGYAGDDGPAMVMRIAQPFGQSADPAGRITFDPAGNLYFADTASSLIRKIDPAGIVTRFAGVAPVAGVAQPGYSGDGGAARDAQLFNPVDLAFDSTGTLYVSDVYNHCIRAIDPSGTITTVAGQCGVAGDGGDGGPAALATLKRPYGIDVDGDVLYISDTGNNVVRSVRLR